MQPSIHVQTRRQLLAHGMTQVKAPACTAHLDRTLARLLQSDTKRGQRAKRLAGARQTPEQMGGEARQGGTHRSGLVPGAWQACFEHETHDVCEKFQSTGFPGSDRLVRREGPVGMSSNCTRPDVCTQT